MEAEWRGDCFSRCMKRGTSMNAMKVGLKIAQNSDCNVLILGPTGSGKTTLAKTLHAQSLRKTNPFVSVNLATLHENTLESELFGHERGAFTGADQRRIGWLEQANGGTLFLDEIGELSPRMQSRLLEFLHSRKIFRVGSTVPIALDVRVIAATHQNLDHKVSTGEFREDLLHRLRVVLLEVPGLSDRLEELDQWVHQMISECAKIYGRPIHAISPQVARIFEKYHWPGNLRELRNVVEYGVLVSDSTKIEEAHLPEWFKKSVWNIDNQMDCADGLGEALLRVAEVPLLADYRKTCDGFEKLYLSEALKRYQGRISATARALGMNKTTLLRRLTLLGVIASGARGQ